MGKIFRYTLPVLVSFLFIGCKEKEPNVLRNSDINKVIQNMTDVMVHDVTNPPLAARFYTYTCLAGYEVMSQNNSGFKSMHGVLNDYPLIAEEKSLKGYSSSLAAVLAMFKTAQKLQPSGFMMKDFEKIFIDSCRKAGFAEETISLSGAYADAVSKQILTYAKKDGYNKISNMPRYRVDHKRGSWALTPPAYIPPVEPYFYMIRKMTLDSAAQFGPRSPAEFSKDKNSRFYRLILANHAKGAKDLTQEETDIANFWDCNPFAVQNEGHMLIGLKKISPGAHWMGITGIACRKANKTFSQTMEIFMVESVGLLDSFISCWQAKYQTNRIRPETAIRAIIDPDWKPFLQTPPFPEYPSGHSVISSSSAVILNHYFGNDFGFNDDVEVKFGIPPKQFRSFEQAANEAGISRFYGGIHFEDAIQNGLVQGGQIGSYVLQKMAGPNRRF